MQRSQRRRLRRDLELLDFYAELLVGGLNPGAAISPAASALLGCGPWAEDLERLLVPLMGEDGQAAADSHRSDVSPTVRALFQVGALGLNRPVHC